MKSTLGRYSRASLVGLAAILASCGDSASDKGAELLSVAETGDLTALNALLGRNAEPNFRNACQWTPLMKAAANGHLEAVRALLDAGADVDAADSGDYTALMLAASNNHAPIIETLLNGGAMIDHQEATQGFTALIWAAKLGHLDAVKVLLSHGADQTLPDQQGKTASDWARSEGLSEILALLEAARSQATPQSAEVPTQ